MSTISACMLLSFLALHFGAIACAWGTRVTVGSSAEGAVQLVFVVAMAAVGFFAWYFRDQGWGLGIPSGATLIVMVLMAVVDFQRLHDPPNVGEPNLQS